MKKINCREDKICVLCKHWLGEDPEIDFISGRGSIKDVKALCAQDGKSHKAMGLCRYFERCLTYL